ncbi:phosphoglycerate kinase [Candidatus Margulisiibacteriota bacterium]
MNKKSITDIPQAELKNKKVLVRVDFNVPLDENQNITDDSRIRAALPTINYLTEAGAKVILCSHLGRPKGEVKEEFRLTPVAARLSELTGIKVEKADDCIGIEVKQAADNLSAGQILLLENVRFYKEETNNDPEFAKKLAENADLYINDAFGTAHRAHASTEGVTKNLPLSAAGFLIKKELDFLGGALENPKRPFIAIIGGAKVSSKISVLRNLIPQVDTLIVGGGMAYTFFKAMGYEVGKSILEPDFVEEAKAIMEEAKKQGTELLLPSDTIIADAFSNEANTAVVDSDQIPADWQGLDIGPKTARIWAEKVKTAATVIWNGPVGAFEMDKYAEGTKAIAKALAESDTISIIGGGDSAAAIKKFGLTDKMTHISTGGGASLEFLEGKALPGIVALQDA